MSFSAGLSPFFPSFFSPFLPSFFSFSSSFPVSLLSFSGVFLLSFLELLGVVVVVVVLFFDGAAFFVDVALVSSTLSSEPLLGVMEHPEEALRTTGLPDDFNAAASASFASGVFGDGERFVGVPGVDLGVDFDLGVVAVEPGLSGRRPLDAVLVFEGGGGVELDLGVAEVVVGDVFVVVGDVLGVVGLLDEVVDLGLEEDRGPGLPDFSLENEFSLVAARLWPLRWMG